MFGKGQPRWRDALKLSSEKAMARFQEFIEGATHRQRFAAAVELGRLTLIEGSDGQRAREIVSSMRQGNFAQRYVALNSCYGSRDTEHIVESVADRSETLRTVARSMIAIYGSDAEVRKTFELSTRANRQAFLRQLKKRKRWAVVDQILESLEISSLSEFATLLPYGSLNFVTSHWPRIEKQCSSIDWERLARNQREFCFERMIALVDATPDFDSRVVANAVAVIEVLSKARFAGAMQLVEALLRISSLSRLAVHPMLRAFPSQTARLAVGDTDRVYLDFLTTYPKIEDHDLLLELIKRYPPRYGIVPILKKLPAVARRKVYDELSAMWRSDGDGVIEEAILELMPTDIRVREARAHLALESLHAHPQIRMQYAPLLPWQEAGEVLKPYLGDPDVQLRMVAWSSLIVALRYHRDELSGVLDQIKQSKRELDPIKQTIFESLSKLPPVIYKSEHLAALASVIQDALDSKDLSVNTAYFIESLLLSLMPFYPEWAATRIAHVSQERGDRGRYGNTWRINEQQALQIEAKIVPVLQQWSRKEYESFVITTANLLGKRLKVTKQILKLLRDIVLDGGQQSSREEAFSLLRRNAFESLRELIPLMLQKDSSWGTKQDVVDYMVRYRQDLLTPFLGTKKHKGRFHSGRNCVVPNLSHRAIFLSAGQQKIYVEALDSMASNDDSRRFENFFVISNLSKIPDLPVKYLTRFLQRPAEAHKAIQALGLLDEGGGVPLLVESLDDPALASVAIYALRKRLLKMPDEEAIKIILSASRDQVTIFKEVVRLLGEVGSEEAYAELLLIAEMNLHRDVRVALLRALWNHLDRSESWQILQHAVNEPEEVVAYTAVRTPDYGLSAEGRDALLSLLHGGLIHQSPRVRLKTLERLSRMPVSDPSLKLLDAIIDSLGSAVPEECRRAGFVLTDSYAHKSLIALPNAATAVMHKRLNIKTLIECIEGSLNFQRSRIVQGVYPTIAALEEDPLTLTLRARLAVVSMPWHQLAQWLKDLDDRKQLHPDLIHEVGSQLKQSLRHDFEQVVELETELRKTDSDPLKRIALYALEAQCEEELDGWNAERLERLESFRRDSSPYIAEVAQFILPEAEEALRALQSL